MFYLCVNKHYVLRKLSRQCLVSTDITANRSVTVCPTALSCALRVRGILTQGVLFILSLSTTHMPHRKPAYTGKSHEDHLAGDGIKGTLCIRAGWHVGERMIHRGHVFLSHTNHTVCSIFVGSWTWLFEVQNLLSGERRQSTNRHLPWGRKQGAEVVLSGQAWAD
jgi:hypothetical protein